ncbi:MAG: hypothetical protein JWP57_4163, partial [Spirosoma sp.]|nr:hypothetical protein [Spirosoma sp.]
MKAGCYIWTLLCGLLVTSQHSHAQCDIILDDYRKISTNRSLQPEQLIKQEINLQERWQACSLPKDSIFIKLLLLTGDSFVSQKKYKSAVQQYQNAIETASVKKQLKQFLTPSAYLLGKAYLFDNQMESAKAAFLTVLKNVTDQPIDRKWGTLSQLHLAYLSFLQGDYQQALAHADLGIDWASDLHDEALIAKLLRERVNALYELNRYEEAATNAHRMIQLAKSAQENKLGPYYLALGDIESARGETEQAIKAYIQATDCYQKANNSVQQAFVLTNLGFLYYSQGNFKQAISEYQHALVLQEDSFSRARLLDNLAACWWKMGQFDKALSTYQQGLAAMPIAFKALSAKHNPSPQAIRLVSQKEYLLTIIQDKADTWLDYAKAMGNNRQRLKLALDTYIIADQMIDYMRWEQTGQQSKLFWRQKTRSMYERAIETCYRLNDAEQAFRLLEKSRAVMLADKINELGAQQKLTRQQIQEEQQLQQAVNKQQNKLANIPTDHNPAYNAAQMVLFAKQDTLNTFVKKLEASNSAYYRYKYDTTTTSLAALQKHLKVQSASLITSFVGDSALYLLAVTGDRTVLKKQSVSA